MGPTIRVRNTGALDGNTVAAPIFKGWNVWDIFQSKDLGFSVWMWGVSRDRQLRIFVEDAVRLGAPGAVVADPLDLKGGQVEILNSQPPGLIQTARKEQLPNFAQALINLQQPADLRTVRFFNRGDESQLLWPSDPNYLLDAVYKPDPSNVVTKGDTAPVTIGDTVASGATQPAGAILSSLVKSPVTWVAAAGLGLYFASKSYGPIKRRRRK